MNSASLLNRLLLNSLLLNYPFFSPINLRGFKWSLFLKPFFTLPQALLLFSTYIKGAQGVNDLELTVEVVNEEQEYSFESTDMTISARYKTAIQKRLVALKRLMGTTHPEDVDILNKA